MTTLEAIAMLCAGGLTGALLAYILHGGKK